MQTDLDAPPPRNRWHPAVWGAAALLLLAPLVAMRFTTEVAWDGADFAVMGLMLAAACGAYEVGTRMSGDAVYRAAFGVAVLGGFLLVWVNLAVGVIGGENNPANLMYLGVLATVAFGSVAVRFRASGMARVLLATALVQASVAIIAIVTGMHQGRTLQLVGVTVFFLGPWLLSAALFGIAARRRVVCAATNGPGPLGLPRDEGNRT